MTRERAAICARETVSKWIDSKTYKLQPLHESELIGEVMDTILTACGEQEKATARRCAEALEVARDVLAAFAKQAGTVPQGGFSATMTDREKKLWEAVQDLETIRKEYSL